MHYDSGMSFSWWAFCVRLLGYPVFAWLLTRMWSISVFHAALLTPYVETPQHGPSFSEPPPEIVEGEEEYEIEAIIAHRNKGKRRQYLVKWLGYPSSENQWLPEKELLNAPDILQQYKNTNKL